MVSILKQMNLGHILWVLFFKCHFNIILFLCLHITNNHSPSSVQLNLCVHFSAPQHTLHAPPFSYAREMSRFGECLTGCRLVSCSVLLVLSTLVNSMLPVLSTTVNGMLSVLITLVNNMLSVLSTLVNNMLLVLSTIVNSMLPVLSTTVDCMLSVLSTLVSGMLSVLSTTVNSMLSVLSTPVNSKNVHTVPHSVHLCLVTFWQ